MRRRLEACGISVDKITIRKEHKLFGVTEVMANGAIWVIDTEALNKILKENK